MLAGSLLAGSIVAGLTGLGAGPAQAEDERPRHQVIERCDPTACLVAWVVADSDGDGVNDADEWMAGTDPNDPASYPPLAVLVDLLEQRRLPTFENGLAALVVMPPDLVDMQVKATGDDLLADLSLAGFPVPARKDQLSRLGISTDLMKEHGIDLERDGFTLGLEPPSKDGGVPGIRLGALDRSLYSGGNGSGTPATTVPAGGPTPTTAPAGGTTPTTAGATPATTAKPDSATPGGGTGSGSGGEAGDDDLAPLKKLEHGGWSKKKDMGDGTTKYYFKDGTVRTVTPTGYVDVKDTLVIKHGSWKKYTNPDAEDAATIDPARFEAWERTLDDTKRTVEGGGPTIGDTDQEIVDRRTHIAYVEGELGLGLYVVTDTPRVTTAQPDVRPDLPSPLDHIPAGSTPKGGSGNDCRDGYCG